jgi:alpha-galactosidase
MYYAFFAPAPAAGATKDEQGEWSGEIELRGLDAGKYHVVDYVNGKDFGEVTAPDAKLNAKFTDHLLIKVTKE